MHTVAYICIRACITYTDLDFIPVAFKKKVLIKNILQDVKGTSLWRIKSKEPMQTNLKQK